MILLSGVVGSTAYGLAREGSDVDRLLLSRIAVGDVDKPRIGYEYCSAFIDVRNHRELSAIVCGINSLPELVTECSHPQGHDLVKVHVRECTGGTIGTVTVRIYALADPEFVRGRGKSLSRMLRETERGQTIRAATSQRLSGEGNHSAKLTWEHVRAIRAEYAAGDVTHSQIADRYGVTEGLVGQIVRHEIWMDATGQSAPAPPVRKRAPRVTDETLVELASVYRGGLGGGKPSQAVARHFNITPVRAYGWIAKARERGMLGATLPGVAGEA